MATRLTGATCLPTRRGPGYHAGMAKLYFHYSTMNAGKSTILLKATHNYAEGGMATYLLTARFDRRAGDGRIPRARPRRQPCPT